MFTTFCHLFGVSTALVMVISPRQQLPHCQLHAHWRWARVAAKHGRLHLTTQMLSQCARAPRESARTDVSRREWLGADRVAGTAAARGGPGQGSRGNEYWSGRSRGH